MRILRLMSPGAEKVKSRLLKLAMRVALGLAMLGAGLVALSKTLGNAEADPVYAGQGITAWRKALNSPDLAVSNAAVSAVRAQVVPQLVHTMLHDTQDSRIRVSLVGFLNQLPGIQIDYWDAGARRAIAAGLVGQLGPAARGAVPELIAVVQGTDTWPKAGAILSLGQIHSDADKVIPVLIPCLADDSLDVPAANALAEFGPLARAAVPKLLPLLHADEHDDQAAAQQALLKIDPEAAAKAGVQAATK